MARSAPLARLVQVNRVLDATVERLEAEFPGVPTQVIYEKVGDARIDAAKRLPNLTAYSEVLARQAGATIRAAAQISSPPTKMQNGCPAGSA